MQTFTNEEIDEMGVDELRYMLKMQLERNELLVRQNKFNMYRYECESGIMHLLACMPDGSLRRMAYPNYLENCPNLIFEEKEHERVTEYIKRIINDPNYPKTGAVSFNYKDGRRISCEYSSLTNEKGEVTAIVGQHVDIFGTHDRLISTIRSLNEMTLISEALASIYDTIIEFDLVNYTYKIVRATPAVRSLSGQVKSIQDLATMFRNAYIDEEYHEAYNKFVDIPTIDERMYGKRCLSCRYKTINIGWCTARIIPLFVTPSGKIEKALFVTESEQNEQSRFGKKDKNTDNLTGLLTVGAGEEIINETLSHKSEGIFMLIGTDFFKAINEMLGATVGDLLTIEISLAIKELYPREVAMRVSPELFVVHITDPEVLDTLKHDGCQQVFRTLSERINRIIIPEMNGITCSVSCAMIHLPANSANCDYKALYYKAHEMLAEVRKSGNGGMVNCVEINNDECCAKHS